MIYNIGESSVSYVLKLQIGSRGHQFPLPKALEKEFAPLVPIHSPFQHSHEGLRFRVP